MPSPWQGGDAVSRRRIGLIINPRSHGNKSRPVPWDAVLARHPDLRRAAPTSPAALREALGRFASDGVDLIVISGGDGTLRDVLSAVPYSDFAVPPDIAILTAGNTNLAGRVLGSPGVGERALERLLQAILAGTVRRKVCPMIEISWPDQPARRPVRGFLFGAAAFTEAKRIANATVHARGLHQGFAVGAAMAATAVRALFGGSTRLTKGTAMRIGIDAEPSSPARRFLVLATTLDSLMLGLWPFWGRGEGDIRWLDIDAPPPRLGAALWAVLRRRPRDWMAHGGYRSGRADAIRIHMDQPFILDGEAFDPGPTGFLLSTSQSVTVLSA